MSRWFAALRSALYAPVVVTLFGWLALESRALDPAIGVDLPFWTPPVGVLVMTLGGALVLLCVGSFAIVGRGTPVPFDPPRRFVATGPYRWVRNPMVLGWLILVIGFGLLHRSVAILTFGALFWLVLHAFVRFYEEPHLERTFGDEYVRYLRDVRRWLPRRPR